MADTAGQRHALIELVFANIAGLWHALIHNRRCLCPNSPQITRLAPALADINVSHCPLLTDRSLRSISYLSELRCLDVSNCRKSSSVALLKGLVWGAGVRGVGSGCGQWVWAVGVGGSYFGLGLEVVWPSCYKLTAFFLSFILLRICVQILHKTIVLRRVSELL